MNIEKNQYLLCSSKIFVDNMKHTNLGEIHLYTDDNLPLLVAKNKINEKVILLGYAFKMDNNKTVEEDIYAWNGRDLKELTFFWTGRFVVITEREFCTDAGSLLSAYYLKKDKEWYISSSIALLQKLGVTYKIRLNELEETSWQIIPETGFYGLKKMLCTEKISFNGNNFYVIPNNWMKDYRELTSKEKAERLANLLTVGLTNIEKYSNRKVYVALTGGKDSRLVLAALLKAGISFSTYTMEHNNISSYDRKLPSRLGKKYGFNHEYIKRTWRADKKLADEFNAFTAGNANGEDERFYSFNQFNKIPSDAIIIRGGFFEAGQRYARSIARGDENFVKDLQRYYSNLEQDLIQSTGLSEWEYSTKKNPILFVDIRDRFYIEQRVGGWGASIEHALSINDFVSIQIANCAELFSILLSCNDEERRELILSYETIRVLKEDLLNEPFNLVSNFDKLKRLFSILKNPLTKFDKFKNRRRIKRIEYNRGK